MSQLFSGHVVTEKGNDYGRVIIITGNDYIDDRKYHDVYKYCNNLIAWQTNKIGNINFGVKLLKNHNNLITKEDEIILKEIIESKLKKIGFVQMIKTAGKHDDIDLSNQEVYFLPNNFYVHGDLFTRGTKIKELPKNLIVDGDIQAHHSSIEVVNNNIHANGIIDLSYSNVVKLPKEIHTQYLDLSHTPISTIKNLRKVNFGLSLSNTAIKELPTRILKYKSLDLSGTDIEKLNEGMHIDGNLDLSFTKIKNLPKRMTITGNLYIRNTEIETIPKNVKVRGVVYQKH